MTKNYTRKYAKDFNILTRLYQLYALYILFFPLSRLFYKVKVEGFENVPKGHPHIYAANHISYLDPFMVALGCRVKIAFIAKIELFQNSKYIAKNIWRLGAFGVNREKPDISTIKSVKEVAKANWSLCIFPQGGIRKNKKLEHITKGFTMMAKMMKYDIVPIAITGCETYNWKIFRRQQINIKVGKPISWELPDEEIIKQWKDVVSNMSGYENVPDEVTQEEIAAAKI